jgi:hypothetical protein
MTNLLFVLSYLQPTFDTADRIKSMLQSFLDGVCKTMNQFGNFCEWVKLHSNMRPSLIPALNQAYITSNAASVRDAFVFRLTAAYKTCPVKMIRSSSYKTKLAGYATAFEDHKKGGMRYTCSLK